MSINKTFSTKSIQKCLGVESQKNIFDKYEYEKVGIAPPLFNSDKFSLRECHENSCFEIASDYWPCYFCSVLHSCDLFPEQEIIQDTNKMCLACNQSAFMLRNIMGCATDIDIIVVVKEDKNHYADLIKKFIIYNSNFHIYDMKYERILFKENDGPIDLFVTEYNDLLESFRMLLTDDWINGTLPSVALWSQTIYHYNFNIGLDFPVAFEPRVLIDKTLDLMFRSTRKKFLRKL